MDKPSVGRIVHYVSPGSADGTFLPAHRAAIITHVEEFKNRDPLVNLTVFNPSGIHFVTGMEYSSEYKPYSWHWPERMDSRDLSGPPGPTPTPGYLGGIS